MENMPKYAKHIKNDKKFLGDLENKMKKDQLRGWKNSSDVLKEKLTSIVKFLRNSEMSQDYDPSVIDIVRNPLNSELEKRTDWHQANVEGVG